VPTAENGGGSSSLKREASAGRGPWRLAVVDTNVVVSGLIGGSTGSPPQRVLDAMLDGRLRFLVSVDLLAEYRAVLLRPFAVERHGLAETEIDELLERLALLAVEAPLISASGALPAGVGRQDAHVARLVLEMPGAVLITGDRALRDALAGQALVASPAGAVEVLEL
jgi:uncharacterized protein